MPFTLPFSMALTLSPITALHTGWDIMVWMGGGFTRWVKTGWIIGFRE